MIDNRDLTKRPAEPPASQLSLVRGQESREERFIMIQRETLNRLNARTTDLIAVVRAHTTLSEQELRCMRVDYVLERARRNKREFRQYGFRSDLINTWAEVEVLTNTLGLLIAQHPELAGDIAAHDEHVAHGTAAIEMVRNPAQAAGVEVAADDIARSLAGVGPIIRRVGETCRLIAQGHLDAIAIDLGRIQGLDDARQLDAAGAMPSSWKQGNDVSPAAVAEATTMVTAAMVKIHDDTTESRTLDASTSAFGR
jgi:hypothetical protein